MKADCRSVAGVARAWPGVLCTTQRVLRGPGESKLVMPLPNANRLDHLDSTSPTVEFQI